MKCRSDLTSGTHVVFYMSPLERDQELSLLVFFSFLNFKKEIRIES